MAGKRRGGFGTVRRLPSGKYQARYYGPDGKRRSAPGTFDRKADAEKCLSLIEVQLMREEWTDPDRGRIPLADYGDRWIEERPGLAPRTVQLYRWLLSKKIVPYLGTVPLNKITTPMVREWRATLLVRAHRSRSRRRRIGCCAES